VPYKSNRVRNQGVQHIGKIEHVILEIVVPAVANPITIPVTPGIDGNHPVAQGKGPGNRVPRPGMIEKTVMQEDGSIGRARPFYNVNL
jgi:hypothetical protein